MAPEQFAGAHCDEKVDVFALATILNECATRRPPWRDFGNAFQVSVHASTSCYCQLRGAHMPSSDRNNLLMYSEAPPFVPVNSGTIKPQVAIASQRKEGIKCVSEAFHAHL